MQGFNSPARLFVWQFAKCSLCTSSRQIFPQWSMLWIYLISEGMNVTWGKTELIAVCTNGDHACRNRQCCLSKKIAGNEEMCRITIIITRDPCGSLWIYLGQKEEERKKNRVRKQMRRLWCDHLMNQGMELLTTAVCHRAMKQHLSDSNFGARLLWCNGTNLVRLFYFTGAFFSVVSSTYMVKIKTR